MTISTSIEQSCTEEAASEMLRSSMQSENATKCHCDNVVGNKFNNIGLYCVSMGLQSHQRDRIARNTRQAAIESLP